MARQRSLDEADIRRRIDTLAGAIRAANLDGVMSHYVRDVVSFDIEPPLGYVGAETKRNHWAGMFAAYRMPPDYEFRDVVIIAGDEVAFGHSFNHVSGTLKNGHRSDLWLRWTACFRKVGGGWLIAHDHVSLPVDVASGTARRDLVP